MVSALREHYDRYVVTAGNVTAATAFLGRWFNFKRGNPTTVENAWPNFNEAHLWPIRLHSINVILDASDGARKQGAFVQLQRMARGGVGGWNIAQELQQFDNYLFRAWPGGIRLDYGFAWQLYVHNFAQDNVVSTQFLYEVLT